MNDQNTALEGNIFKVFFSYSIPTILGMLAITSAGIIDGMFVGNFVGTEALAAISLCTPVFSLLFGIPILFSTGGEVFCGKYIGEGNIEKAQTIFTSILIIIGAISILITFFGLYYTESIAVVLGANEKVKPIVIEYLKVIIGLTPIMSCYSLTYFVRVDGNPNLSFLSLLLVAIANILLDYIFVVQLNWGIKGAALGTSIAYCILPILLIPHFISKKGHLAFRFEKINLKIIQGVIYNGSSEFLSELSSGILFFIININMIKYYGTEGVAAFAIIGYLLYFINMLIYGMSDGLKSIVSVNFGAKLMNRAIQFLKISLSSSIIIGSIISLMTYLFINDFVDLFLEQNSTIARSLTIRFIKVTLLILPFIGINILLASFFTALHKPKPSLIISFLRSLILPIIFISLLTAIWGGDGVIRSIALTEIITLFISLGLYYHYFRNTKWINLHQNAN